MRSGCVPVREAPSNEHVYGVWTHLLAGSWQAFSWKGKIEMAAPVFVIEVRCKILILISCNILICSEYSRY